MYHYSHSVFYLFILFCSPLLGMYYIIFYPVHIIIVIVILTCYIGQFWTPYNTWYFDSALNKVSESSTTWANLQGRSITGLKISQQGYVFLSTQSSHLLLSLLFPSLILFSRSTTLFCNNTIPYFWGCQNNEFSASHIWWWHHCSRYKSSHESSLLILIFT